MLSSSEKRIIEFDILKALAIIGVISIHVVSGALFYFKAQTFNFKFYLFIDQFFRFSVPTFVALSGYTLTLRYKDQTLKLTEFFKRRVIRILPWYFFWSAVIYFYLRFIQPQTSANYPLWKILFLGKADYHLYFVPMIFQLYVLFPIFLWLYKKLSYLLLGLAFVFQVIFYQVLSLYSLNKLQLSLFLNDQQQYLFFGTWIFYFVLGMALSDSDKIPKKLLAAVKKISLVLLPLGFLLMFSNTLSIVSNRLDVIISTRSTRIPVLIYVTAFILVSVLFRDKLLKLPKNFIRLGEGVGKRSYITYLLHTIVLRIFTLYIPISSNVNVFIVALLVIIVSDYTAYLSDRARTLLKIRAFIFNFGERFTNFFT